MGCNHVVVGLLMDQLALLIALKVCKDGTNVDINVLSLTLNHISSLKHIDRSINHGGMFIKYQ